MGLNQVDKSLTTKAQVITSTSTFTPRANMKNLRAIMVGGGAGGTGAPGGSTSVSTTSGGATGGSSSPVKYGVQIPSNIPSLTVVIGSGGAGGAGGPGGVGTDNGIAGSNGGSTIVSGSVFYELCPGGLSNSRTFIRNGATKGAQSNVNGVSASNQGVTGAIYDKFVFEGACSAAGGPGTGASNGTSGNGNASIFTMRPAPVAAVTNSGDDGGDGFVGYGSLVSATNGSNASSGSATPGSGGLGYGAGGGGGAGTNTPNNGSTGGAGGAGAPGIVVFLWEE